MYRVMVLIWILFGIGYVLMIIGFLTAIIRSKLAARIKRKLANNIKLSQSKLCSSIMRDVHQLRRILNEMYLMTLKVSFSLIITS